MDQQSSFTPEKITPHSNNQKNQSTIDLLNQTHQNELEIYKTLPTLLEKANIHTRKTTVTFLRNFIESYEKNKHDLDVTRIVSFLNMLNAIINALEATNEKKDIAESRFVVKILNSLQALLPENEKEKFKKTYVIGKKENGSKKIKKMDDISARIKLLLVSLSFSLPKNVYNKFSTGKDGALESMQLLFNYCAQQELDEKKDSTAIREKIYAILLDYFKSSTPQSYVELFKKISEGIQLSRSKGDDGYLLTSFRDAILENLLFKNGDAETFFDKNQVESILEHINYKTDKDMEISKHTMKLIDILEKKESCSRHDLKLKYIEQLLCYSPQNKKILPPQYYLEKGSDFAKKLTLLIQDKSLLIAERKKAMLLGFIWNYWMTALNNDKLLTNDYLVTMDNHLMGPREIEKDPLFIAWTGKLTKNKNIKFDFNQAHTDIYQLSHDLGQQTALSLDLAKSSSSTTSSFRSNSSGSENITPTISPRNLPLDNLSPATTPRTSPAVTPRGPGFFCPPPTDQIPAPIPTLLPLSSSSNPILPPLDPTHKNDTIPTPEKTETHAGGFINQLNQGRSELKPLRISADNQNNEPSNTNDLGDILQNALKNRRVHVRNTIYQKNQDDNAGWEEDEKNNSSSQVLVLPKKQ